MVARRQATRGRRRATYPGPRAAGSSPLCRRRPARGHDDRDGAVLRRLGDLRRGDVVWVYAGTHPYRYAVSALRIVPATRTDVVRPTPGAILTLITCTPYLIDTQRLVVRARLLP